MMTIYEIDVAVQPIDQNLDRLCNQIFKLLPLREEGVDWIKPMETVIIEILGLSALFAEFQTLLALACKLEGLKSEGDKVDFLLYRRTIFECCGMIQKAREQCH